MSTESQSRSCGCRYIRLRGETADALFWYQVVACPDHLLDFRPQAEIPGDGDAES